MPQTDNVHFLKKRGECNGLVYMVQKFPWPFKNRDLTFHYSGVGDYTNHAMIAVSQSLAEGQDYFGTIVPPPKGKNVRMEFIHMYNYFQYLGPNKCRHIQIMNVDPKIRLLPTKILDQLLRSNIKVSLNGIHDFSKKM